MITKAYYFPASQISKYVINQLCLSIGCGVGDIQINEVNHTMRVPLTFNERDLKNVEETLYKYGCPATGR